MCEVDLRVGGPGPCAGTAATAPLYFVQAGTVVNSAPDPEPVVHNAVGIFLKHAGTRDPGALHRFLAAHGDSMPRPALRLAIAKLDPGDRRYLT